MFSWFAHVLSYSPDFYAPRSKTLVDNAQPVYVSHEQTGDLRLKLRTRAAAYGIAGLALAGAVIFSGSTLGLLNPTSLGILSVLLTDPPSIPNGVTAVYVSYSSIAVHAAGLNDSGWISFSGQGTIDTLKLINLSQTISSGNVPSLTYNLVEFNISKVEVQYNGANYTTAIASGKLVVPIVGGVKVSSSNPAAALVDIQPTVLNLGNDTSPSFTIATGARALQVPSAEVSDSMKSVGNSYSLEGHSWFQTFREHPSANLTVSGVALSSSSLSFSVLNPGTDPATIRMVIVTPLSKGEGMGMSTGSMANSFLFAVQSDGSLRLVNGTPDQVSPLFGSSGYTMAAGASRTFSFSGTITNLLAKHGIASGEKYNVALMGSEALAVQTVTAS